MENSFIILIAGAAGTGKTTLAKKLSEELHVPVFHKDVLKERLYDFGDGKTIEDSKLYGKLSVQILYDILRTMCRSNTSCIIESPFSYEEDDKLLRKIISESISVISIVCTCNEKERQRRINERVIEGLRHKSHHDQQREHQLLREDYGGLPGKKIILDTTAASTDEILKAALEKIKNNLA